MAEEVSEGERTIKSERRRDMAILKNQSSGVVVNFVSK